MGDFGAGWAGAGVEAAGAVAANRANLKLSRHARKWQEAMANSAYQRTVKDLRAAGLNPLLAMGGGISAGSFPSTQVPIMRSPTAGFGERFSSAARGSVRSASELQILKETAAKARSDALTASNLAKASQYEPERAYHAVFSEANRGSDLMSSATLKDAEAERTKANTAYTNILAEGEKYQNVGRLWDATEFNQFLRRAERAVGLVPFTALQRGVSGAAGRGGRQVEHIHRRVNKHGEVE